MIVDVNRAGWETTVNNVMYLLNSSLNGMYLFNTMIQLLNFEMFKLLNNFIACYHGLYGLHCTQTCNDKCDGCNNVNGVCDRGCKPGWRGDYCQQRNDIQNSMILFFLFFGFNKMVIIQSYLDAFDC